MSKAKRTIVSGEKLSLFNAAYSSHIIIQVTNGVLNLEATDFFRGEIIINGRKIELELKGGNVEISHSIGLTVEE